MPTALAARTSAPIVVISSRYNGATDENVRADRAALPGLVDRIDALVADGVIGGPEPNAADFQIATGVRLLMAFNDLRPALERRPTGELARRVVPGYPGRLPRVLPPERVPDLRASAPRTS